MATALLKLTDVQLGVSATATNNFTIYQPASPDGTVRLGNGNSGSVTDVLTATSAGNVGIGTNSPDTKLGVNGKIALADDLVFGASATNATRRAYLTYNAGGDNGSLLLSADPSNGYASSFMRFDVDGSERMRIDSSGNVGIGTSSPAAGYKLTLSANGSGTPQAGIYFDDTNSATAKFGIYNNASNLYFRDTVAGTTRMMIDSSGNLLVGTTSAGFATLGAMNSIAGRLAVKNTSNASQLICWNAAGTSGYYELMSFSNNAGTAWIGSITRTNDSSVNYNTTSDYRLKENIQPMQNALATVAKLNPVTYVWKEDGSDGQGFIAHELQAVVPDCVTGEKDAEDEDGNPVYQGIDTSFLVATLTAAIKEQQAIIESLTKRIETLEGAK